MVDVGVYHLSKSDINRQLRNDTILLSTQEWFSFFV